MFVRSCWYVAAWSEDVVSGEPYPVTILGEAIVVYRLGSGGYAALEDHCVHRLAPLSLGRCEGDNLRCMYHGLMFDPSGRCTEIPGQDMIPAKARVATYPVEERDGWIWIWMGERSAADPALIPNSYGPASTDWRLATGHIDYEANFQLINDNLTDFSHLSFVHANSFRSGLNWALSRPRIATLERGIRVERWVEEDPVPPFLEGRGFNSVDQYIHYDYLVPGILLMRTEIHPGGTAAPLGEDRPEPLFGTFSAQAVTPIDERRSRYFFSWGPRAKDGDEQMASAMMGVARMAFDEDRAMIEAQQKVIDRDPDRQPMPIAADKGVTLFQRMMAGFVREDNRAPES
jgi:vanillate O-demethylase monooxygenase subunit